MSHFLLLIFYFIFYLFFYFYLILILFYFVCFDFILFLGLSLSLSLPLHLTSSTITTSHLYTSTPPLLLPLLLHPRNDLVALCSLPDLFSRAQTLTVSACVCLSVCVRVPRVFSDEFGNWPRVVILVAV